MKKHLLVIAVLLWVPLSLTHAQKSLQFSIAPSIGQYYGETEYVMDIVSPFVDENGDLITDEFGDPIIFQLKSQLEYPMDVVMGGVNLRLNPANDPDKWSVEAGIFTSLNDPGGVMKDSDWEGAIGIYDFTQWSYTESESKMSSLMFDIKGTRRVFCPGKFSVSLVAGFRYQRIEQELFGVNGWQRPFDDIALEYGDAQFFALLQDTLVLYYEVKYTMPRAGLSSRLDLSPNLSLGLETVLSSVWFKDVDDHILRNKLSKADGSGLGFTGIFSAHYQLGSSGSQAAPFVDFFVEYNAISASGDQTQEWYGDDEFTEGDDTGNTIEGVPHDVNANLYHVGMKLGLSF